MQQASWKVLDTEESREAKLGCGMDAKTSLPRKLGVKKRAGGHPIAWADVKIQLGSVERLRLISSFPEISFYGTHSVRIRPEAGVFRIYCKYPLSRVRGQHGLRIENDVLNMTKETRNLLLIVLALALTTTDARIKTVHLIFANHLDIGYHINIPGVVGNDANVLSQYMTEFMGKAATIANDLRKLGGPERYRYLTHSFLVSFLDCPTHIGIKCPSPEEISIFEDAVKRGDIVWHALPHNFQAEFMDSELLDYAVRLGHELDQRFSLPLKKVMSQRDVPGLTRAAIPILAYSGVTAISVGVNSGSAPPAVPKYTPFIWKDKRTRTSLIAFWHPGGYSDVPVDSAEHCIRARHFDHVLCGAWRGDNEGPHSVEEVLDIYNRTREAFRDAQVDVSTLDAFVTELEKDLPNLDLPVVTDEIGDTWIYGVASDPARTAEFRALLRLRRASGDRYDDAAFNKFSRLLLKIPEHTWGVDTKDYPGDYTRWSNIELQQALSTNDPKFMAAIDSWVRQRAYGTWALEELPENDLGRNVLAEMQQSYGMLHQ